MKALLDRIINWDAHHRLVFAALASVSVVLMTGHLRLPVEIVVAWNAFALTVLVLAWVRIFLGKPEKYLASAKLQDSSRSTIFLFVIIAACVSIFGVIYLLGTAKSLERAGLTKHVMLAIATVVGSWGLIHTLFTLHYAHTYYGDRDDDNCPGRHGGLDFPGEENPDYLDFAYFSFVLGMACQVSDVQVSDRGLRRLALFHGMLSFAFNTIILALSLNIVSGLLSG